MRCTAAVSRGLALCRPPVGMATALKTPESWMGWMVAKIRYWLLGGYRLSATYHRCSKSPQHPHQMKLFASRFPCRADPSTACTPGSSAIPIETHRVLISTTQNHMSINSAAVGRFSTPLYLSVWRSTSPSYRMFK
ncbi:hypothetical protein LY76DRAFT_70725 [Colletotrichum caudatum]|nr:hypothetical protein LY76DRAFT_70725 [Colletotrichum caudatum]